MYLRFSASHARERLPAWGLHSKGFHLNHSFRWFKMFEAFWPIVTSCVTCKVFSWLRRCLLLTVF